MIDCMIHITFVLQATVLGTWSLELLYSLSELQHIVLSLAYDRRLFTRTRRPLIRLVKRIGVTSEWSTKLDYRMLERLSNGGQQTALKLKGESK